MLRGRASGAQGQGGTEQQGPDGCFHRIYIVPKNFVICLPSQSRIVDHQAAAAEGEAS